MDHFQQIYSEKARAYHEMISVEDVDGSLLPALNAVAPLAGKRVLDLGSGTGRIPLLIHRTAGSLLGLDLHLPMLEEQAVQRRQCGGAWFLSQGDMRQLPLPAAWADVVIAGWAIGHLRAWFAADWKKEIGKIMAEMMRACKPGGALIVLETLTTGSLTPAPPTPELGEYYAWMENEHGFARRVIQTDYRFSSVDEAVQKTEFFFGRELAGEIRRNDWARLPEWTGLWSRIN